MKPSVIVAPDFRPMADVFRPEALSRLAEVAEIVWAQDGPMSQAEFETALKHATAVVFGTWSYGDALRADTPQLRAALEVAGAHDHHEMNYELAFEKGLEVGSCAPAFGPAVAEMGLGLTLAAIRGIAHEDRLFRSAAEHWVHDESHGLHTLFRRRVGFVGCGGLSVALHDLLRPFNVSIVGYDPFLSDGQLQARGIQPGDLETIVETCDIVYVLAAPTTENEALVSADLLGRLQPHQSLILISRAHLVDFDVMTDFVIQGRFRLGCDVFPDEPLPADHPLRHADRAVLSGHRAGAVEDALLMIGDLVVDDLVAILTDSAERHLQYLTPDRMSALVQPPPKQRR